MSEIPHYVTVDFDDLTRQKELGNRIALPHSPELVEALQLIKSHCDVIVNKRKAYAREEFLTHRYSDLKKAEGDISKVRKILYDILEYGRDSK